jgi:class 3 adenylate cyclase
MVRGTLVLVDSEKGGRAFSLEKQTITIGRAPDNDIVLGDKTVSRHHARITFEPSPAVEDTGSTPGTLVGDVRVLSRHPLRSGDVITLGGVQLRFELPRPQEPAQNPAVVTDDRKKENLPQAAPAARPARTRPVSFLSGLLHFLHEHIIATLAILFTVGMLLILANLYNLAMQINKQTAEQYAANLVLSLSKFRSLYGTDVVDRVQNYGILVTADYANHEAAIPIPSTLGIEISQQITGASSNIQARLYSDYPFPSRTDGGAHTDFEKTALTRLRAQKDTSAPYIQYSNIDGRLSLEYAQAVIMGKSCVACHNSQADSPKKDWKVGDVGGVQEVVIPIDSAVTTIRSGLLTTLVVMLFITIAGLLLLAVVLSALRGSVKMLSRTNAAYARFVPGEFLSLLGKKSIVDVALSDNVQMEMTVLFSDIRSFTSISEGMDPHRNFQFISEFLSKMGPLVRENHGFIDKYIGDAIMALFQSEDDAVDAAIALNRELVGYNQVRQENQLPPIDIGVGLNTGMLTLGTLGETDRMDGTVVSDTVNLASRIEGMTKMYNVRVLVSENTLSGLKDVDRYSIRLLDHVRVKGKANQVTIYEVFNGDAPEIVEKKLAIKETFERGVRLYQLKQFQAAKNLFDQCLETFPEDKATEFYIERCNRIIHIGIDDDWDGVLTLDSK